MSSVFGAAFPTAALLLCLSLPTASGQEAAGATAEPNPVVLQEELEPWVGSAFRAAAICRETIGQMINEHALFTDANRLANAQELHQALSTVLDAARTEMFAKGLSFEQSQQIDLYFISLTQPKTARFAQTRQAGDLAIDLRRCPAAAAELQQSL